MRSRSKYLRALVALAALVALVAAGCGGGDDDGGDAAGASAGGATGEPIRVMTVATVQNTAGNQLSPFENQWEAARIFGEMTNDEGGIGPDGQPLDVILCDDKGTANGARKCAEQAIDEGVTAVLGSFSSSDTAEIETLQKAGIAYFGTCCGQSPTGFTAPNSFPFGNQWSLSLGMGVAAASQCDSVGLVNFQAPGFTEFTNGLYESALKGWGKELKVKAYVPLDATDLSPQASQATDGTDCVIFGVGEPQAIQLLQAMKQSGIDDDVRIFGMQGNLTAKACSAAPSICEDAVIIGIYPDISADAWEEYRAALEEYDAKEGLDYNSLGGMGTWAAYEGFEHVVDGMEGPIDADTFLEAASNESDLDTGGMTPELDLSQEWDHPEFPRMFNRHATYTIMEGGEFRPLIDGFVNLEPAANGEKVDPGF